jgi:hypothetical protein
MKMLDTARHSLDDQAYADECRRRLDESGALVLKGFFTAEAVELIVAESADHKGEAFYAASTHNVYLTESDPSLDVTHAYNRQIVSSKGLIADDQVPATSVLRELYESETFRRFLCGVLGIDAIYPYADRLSSINVHFAADGMELGWHFDNSSFAVTMLLRAPAGGGEFQHVPAVRNVEVGDQAFERVDEVLDGRVQPDTLQFEPGDLVLFRGRNALHRVTPTEGPITRMLAVFAFNDQPGVKLSDSALATFYGRT